MIILFWLPLISQSRVVVLCSTRARRQDLFHLWHLRAKPGTRAWASCWAPAEGEGRFAHRGRGPGAFQHLAAGSEGHGCQPAGRTITHCDHTHSWPRTNKCNKTIAICCSGSAKPQNNLLTIERALYVWLMWLFIIIAPSFLRAYWDIWKSGEWHTLLSQNRKCFRLQVW